MNMPLHVSKVFKMHVKCIMKMYIYILFGFVLIAICLDLIQ